MGKTRSIAIAALIALLSAVLLITATFALFTDSTTVKNYLQAGTLEIGLARTNLTGQLPDEDGILQAESTDNTRVELTDENTDSVKVFTLDEELVPGSWQEATLEIKNNGSVAFDYSLSFFYEEKPKADSPEQRLAEKLLVIVTNAEGNVVTQGLSLAGVVERGELALGSIIEQSAAQTFTIKVQFPLDENVLDDGGTDTVMNAKLAFNFTVTATQKTAQA